MLLENVIVMDINLDGVMYIKMIFTYAKRTTKSSLIYATYFCIIFRRKEAKQHTYKKKAIHFHFAILKFFSGLLDRPHTVDS